MRYTVDVEQLADWADDLKSFDGNCEQIISDVDALVKLLHLHWEGQAASAHAENHARWVRDLEVMREAVADIQKGAGRAHKNYETIVSTNQRMWGF
jgi:WXG100 family type VII secretion target